MATMGKSPLGHEGNHVRSCAARLTQPKWPSNVPSNRVRVRSVPRIMRRGDSLAEPIFIAVSNSASQLVSFFAELLTS